MERGEITWSSFDFVNETDFEKIILKKDILKNYHVYDAKKTLNIFRKYNRYADVLLIEKKYKYWSIGEIEISKHSFKNHIFPQLIEIHTLMQENIELIRKNYLDIEGLENSKNIEDLIKFNKPFLNLIIDKFPSNYNNIIPLLNSFCNINLVQRFKNSIENYIYVNNDYYLDLIDKNISYCYVNDIVLIIDNPNLLELNKFEMEFVEYKGERIPVQQQYGKIGGFERLFWIMGDKIKDGKYKLSKEKNNFKIYR